jgi:hypothetical protein
MRTLRLELESIRVESFTAGAALAPGTVVGHADESGDEPKVTCGASCADTCETCAGNSCGSACRGTCASGGNVCCA